LQELLHFEDQKTKSQKKKEKKKKKQKKQKKKKKKKTQKQNPILGFVVMSFVLLGSLCV
jgi:cell division septal protein FtsQ